MERLLSLLPPAQPVIVRYGMTTVFVLVCWLLEIGVQAQSGMIGLFLLMPAIFLASIIFDRGSGFYATILSAGLSITGLHLTNAWMLEHYLVPLLLFVLFGMGLAAAGEGMRTALKRAVAAERATTVMIQELNHRVRNNLSTVTSMLRLQMRLQTDEAARDAFNAAVGPSSGRCQRA